MVYKVDSRQSTQKKQGYTQYKKTRELTTMATTARSSGISTGVEGCNDSKRPRTATATTSVNEEGTINNKNPSHALFFVDGNEDNNMELPTPVELSKELCKIVSDRYSRDESLRALKNLYNWAFTEDADFIKLFYTYGGIVRVVDFLKATLSDISCKGSIRMECIKDAADVIAQIAYKEEDAKIIATLSNCDGINALIAGSEEYTGGKGVPELKAVCSVWGAFRNLTCLTSDSLMIQDTAIAIFATGIDTMSQLKSDDSEFASITLEDIFYSLNGIVDHDHVTKKNFQDNNILSKCSDVFKKDGTWNFRSCEGLIQNAVDFFDTCRIKYLLNESIDYEMILPLLVVVLKKFPSNYRIRGCIVSILDDACSSEANNKQIILKLGVMEPLGLLFASDKFSDEDEKNEVRTLIIRIIE